MSYDLYLYRKNNIKKPYDSGEVLKKLNKTFKYIYEHVESDKVIGFDVGYDIKAPEIDVSYQGEEKGYYFTYCSYAVENNTFIKFKEMVVDIAKGLDMLICDPQIKPYSSTRTQNPSEYNVDSIESRRAVSIVRSSLRQFEKLSPYILPTKEKHFIIYFISSTDPKTNKDFSLTLGNNRFYASKVNVGESIKDVVDREIVELTGSSKYDFMNIKRSDTAKDKYGNELERYALFIDVPFFNLKNRKTKYKMIWEKL
jgi:hypothetical protein